MASVGTVKSVTGVVRVIAENGTERMLSVGDTVNENEKIITGSGEISIALNDGSLMDLASNSGTVLKGDVLNQGSEQTANDEVAALQDALADPNFDPTTDLPATAAGPAAAGGTGNNGHTLTSIDYLNPEAPVESGFDTVGIKQEILQVDDGLYAQIEDEPVVSVFVEIGGESVLEGTSEGAKQVEFIISLDKVFSTDVQVSYQLKSISANNPDDWFAGDLVQTVTIPTGTTTIGVTASVVEDHFDEVDESFEIILLRAEGATINPAADSAVITINDDDTSPVANDDVYTTGEDTALVIPVSGVLVNDTDADGDVLSTISNTAPSNGSVTLNADGSFTYVPDANFNGTDSFEYTITDGYNAPSTATVTINITPDVPTVSVSGSTVEEGSLAKFTVSLSETHESALTVNLSMLSGSADASDFNNTQFFDASGNAIGNNVVFQVGENSAEVYVQTIDNDPPYGEPLENYTVTAALQGGNTSNAQGGITDFSTPPPPSVIGVSISGGNAVEGHAITFTLNQDGVSSQETAVMVEVLSLVGDSAIEGSDYETINTVTVIIPAGLQSATFSVATLIDRLSDNGETFTARIKDVTNLNGNVSIDTATAVGTILDNNNSILLSVDEGLISDTDTDAGLTFTAGTFDLTTFKFSNDLSALQVDSNGAEAGGGVVWTRINDTEITGSTDGGATTALTLTLSASTISAGNTGNVTVTAVLDDSFKHDLVAGKNSINLGNIDVVASNAEGDEGAGTVGVKVIDDIAEVIYVSNTLLLNNVGAIGDGWLVVDEGEDGLGSLIFSGVAPTGLQTLSGESISYESQVDGSLKAIDASGGDVFVLSSSGSDYALELKQIFQSSDPSVDTILDFDVNVADTDGDVHGGHFQVSFDTNNDGVHSIAMNDPTLAALVT